MLVIPRKIFKKNCTTHLCKSENLFIALQFLLKNYSFHYRILT